MWGDVGRYECAQYALFPGQVVAVRGVNLLGHTIRASRVLCGSPPPNAVPPSEREITPEPFNVITATGRPPALPPPPPCPEPADHASTPLLL